MNTITIISIVLIVIIFLFNIIKGVAANSMNEDDIEKFVTINLALVTTMFLFMFFGSWGMEVAAVSTERIKYEEAMLNDTWEIRTKHDLIINEEGDTIKNETDRYVYIIDDKEQD